MLDRLRIGIGYDVHAFAKGRPLILGGVEIPHTHGLEGHSDADALIHSIVDAILGALGEGDIGQHFPPSDPQWKGAPSTAFLRYAKELVEKKGGRILSIDAVLILEEPKMRPHIEKIRAHLSQTLDLDISRVHAKATTTEKLGFTGRKEGIAAQAICLLERGHDKPSQ